MLDLAPIQIFFLLIGIGLVFSGVSMVFFKAFPEKRSNHLKDIAFQLGFSFREKGDGSITRDFNTLPFFHSCKNGLEENVMTKGMGEAFVAILDFTRALQEDDLPKESDEEQKITQTQTLICFKSNHLDLPQFLIQPDRYFDLLYARYLEEIFNLQCIECQTFPVFSQYFKVYGKNDSKIRKIIQNSGINHLCEKEKDLCIEGNGNNLLVYRFQKQMAPQETELFFDLAHQVHNILEYGNWTL
ncbi:MAG: hypothetical protein JXK94_01940 [Deltaproteobacteria bacterium]|nr:hypothetical protein [Deltaproteobacteria bacterium]